MKRGGLMSLTENHTIAELLYENGKLSEELEADKSQQYRTDRRWNQ